MSAVENPPAFPVVIPAGHEWADNGMSLRDWFAGQALAGTGEMAFRTAALEAGNDLEAAVEVAQFAYKIADAMLAARAKGGDA